MNPEIAVVAIYTCGHFIVHKCRSQSGWSGFGRTTFSAIEIHYRCILKIACMLCACLLKPDHFKVLPTPLIYM